MKTKVIQSLQCQKLHHDKSTKARAFDVDDNVFVKNHQGTPTWLEGIVTKVTGPLSYKIKLSNGSIIRRHVDHIRIRHSPPQQDLSADISIDDSFMFPQQQPASTSPTKSAPQ